MIEQAKELIDFGNSHEKAEGFGMMIVIEAVKHIAEAEYFTTEEKVANIKWLLNN